MWKLNLSKNLRERILRKKNKNASQQRGRDNLQISLYLVIKGITVMGIISILSSLIPGAGRADEHPKVGDMAPSIVTQTGSGEAFNLTDRKGKWTVLYFYPKDDTPGCTVQAKTFRDQIDSVRKLNAEVYGVSNDSVESHGKFSKKYDLNFPLLADPKSEIIKAYGTGSILGVSKRWTFIVGPELKIRWIQKSVVPAKNASEVAEVLKSLQSGDQ